MTQEQKVEFWFWVNEIVLASGGRDDDTSVERQKAVVEIERIIAEVESGARRSAINFALDEALNSDDGSYRP